MVSVLLAGAISFLVTLFTIPAIIRVAEQKKLYDVPDARKLHTRSIASLGGVGIFIGFILAMLLTLSNTGHPEFQYFFAAAIVIFFLGIKDDILILSPVKKFMVQLAAAAILIHLGGIRIDSMHGLFGVTALPQALSLLLTYSTMIVVINAFNLIDGVDGLAGSLGLLTSLVFGFYFFWMGLTPYALLAFAMGGSLAAFLIFNFNPAKIFMGDSGSLLLGLVNAILVIKFIQVADAGAAVLPLGSAVALGISVIMVPLADTLRVFSIRIYQGRSPFSPDCNHIHHLLLQRGLNHKQVTVTCLLLNCLFILTAFFSRGFGNAYVLLSLTALSAMFLGVVVYGVKPVTTLKPVRKPFLQSADAFVMVSPSTAKVVVMTTDAAVAEN